MSGLFYRLNRRFGPLSKLSQDELLASRREAMKATLLAHSGEPTAATPVPHAARGDGTGAG